MGSPPRSAGQAEGIFERYLSGWDLVPDGEAIATHSSHLLPVRRAGSPAMLKVAVADEERWGAGLMVWWDGDGAARVLAHDENALLLERAMGQRSLRGLVSQGRDDEATRIICRLAEKLHARREKPLPALLPLARWFAALEPAAARNGGILRRSAGLAAQLLADRRDPVVLHGDLHHGNVLDFGTRGWLAIDPKRLVGERTFDFVNLLRNPQPAVALSPRRFRQQVGVIVEAAGLERRRLLEWTLAFAGLSAAWWLADGQEPRTDLTVAEMAAAALDLP